MKGISYIITTYNRNILLEKAIDSIISERIFPSELIIIDDCGAQEIVFSARAKMAFGEEIRLIRNAQNLGVIGARNAGIMAAKYDFLLFLDDDDESFSNRSKDLFSYISESNYAFVAAKCEMRTPSSMKIVPNTGKMELDTANLLLFPAHINGIIWRKSALLALNGMDNRVPYLGEHISMQLMLLKGEKALQVEEVVAYFSYLEDGLTQNVTKENVMKARLMAFCEILAQESENTSSHVYFSQINRLLPEQNIATFDDYLAFITPILSDF
jgi:glycosyltransferase involved in cell wall biosynthesis